MDESLVKKCLEETVKKIQTEFNSWTDNLIFDYHSIPAKTRLDTLVFETKISTLESSKVNLDRIIKNLTREENDGVVL